MFISNRGVNNNLSIYEFSRHILRYEVIKIFSFLLFFIYILLQLAEVLL